MRTAEVLRYRWKNTGNPVALDAHRRLDEQRGTGRLITSVPAGGGVSLCYAGLPAGRLNILRLLEQQREAITPGPVNTREHPAVPWAGVLDGSALPAADIVLLGAEAARLRGSRLERAFLLPFRIHLVVDTTADAETVHRRISKTERWEFDRGARRNGWELREANTPADLEFFYRRMHVPTMHARHEGQIRSESLGVAHTILARGRLFLLLQGGRPIAGSLCQTVGRTLVSRLIGVLDGSTEHYESGAFKAVYHLTLRWAAERPDIDAFDLFGTEAFLSKGIYQFKRKFHPCVVLPPNHFRTKRLLVSVRQDTPHVRDFLVRNPFLRMTSAGDFEPIYFFDTDRPACTEVSAKARNVRSPTRVDLDDFLAGAPVAAPRREGHLSWL